MISSNIEELQLQVQYCHVQYNEGNYLFSAVLIASIFEHYIHLKTKNHFINNEYPLTSAIRHLTERIEKYSKKELDTLRECRNNLIHNNKSKKKYIQCIKSLLNFLEKELFGETLGYLSDFERQHIFEMLRDEGLIANKRQSNSKKFNLINAEDFFDLYKMRDKFLALSERLTNNSKLIDIGLTKSSVSHVDGTSGYVWLSVFNGSSSYKVEQLSLSILATPESLRIYLDFGGKAFNARRNYLQLFENNIFLDELLSFKHKEDLYIFDIEWYHTIVQKSKLADFQEDVLKDLDAVYYRLSQDVKDKETITWNKNLVGYITPRDNIEIADIDNKIDDISSIIKLIQAKL